MWLVHLAMAFLPSLTIWLIGSWVVANYIFKIEARSPALMGTSRWKAVETALVSGVFFGSVAIWIALAMVLDWTIE